MKKVNIFFLTAMVLAACPGKLFSQMVSYRVVDEKVKGSNFNIVLHLCDLDFAAKQSASLGFGVSGTLTIGKLLTADICAGKSYSKKTDYNYKSSVKTDYILATLNTPVDYMHIEAGGMLHLSDRRHTQDRKIILGKYYSSDEYYNYSNEKYLMVPTEVRVMFGVRGGFYNEQFSINDRQQGSLKENEKSKDGGVVAADGTGFGWSAVSTSPYYNTRAVSNMQVTGFYAGICRAQLWNITIRAKGFGDRSTRKFSRFYLDGILANPSIEDFKTLDGKTYKLSGDSAKGFKTRPYGARLGFEVVHNGKVVAMYYKIEGGAKPGFDEHHFYIAATIGVAFRGKL